MWRILPLLLLAACSTGTCRLQAVADLPVTLDRNRLLAAGEIGGLATPVLIDTGAERSIVSTATVEALRLPRSQRSATVLSGVGGVVSNADVFAAITLGGASQGGRLPVAAVEGVGGIVGADLLGGYDLDLDLPAGRVRLWRAAGCGLASLPLPPGSTTVPVEVTGRSLLRLQAQLDGHPLAAYLDSGAGITLLQAEAARRAGAGSVAGDPATVGRGVDGGTIAVRRHIFGALDVAGERIASPRVGIAEYRLPGAEMLLGVDYLRTRRVWVAYRTGQLFIARTGRAAPP